MKRVSVAVAVFSVVFLGLAEVGHAIEASAWPMFYNSRDRVLTMSVDFTHPDPIADDNCYIFDFVLTVATLDDVTLGVYEGQAVADMGSRNASKVVHVDISPGLPPGFKWNIDVTATTLFPVEPTVYTLRIEVGEGLRMQRPSRNQQGPYILEMEVEAGEPVELAIQIVPAPHVEWSGDVGALTGLRGQEWLLKVESMDQDYTLVAEDSRR